LDLASILGSLNGTYKTKLSTTVKRKRPSWFKKKCEMISKCGIGNFNDIVQEMY